MRACIVLCTGLAFRAVKAGRLEDNGEAHLYKCSTEESTEEGEKHFELVLITVASLLKHLLHVETVVLVDPFLKIILVHIWIII